MRQAALFRLGLYGVFALGWVLSSAPAMAAGPSGIAYSTDGKAATKACIAHLAGQPPTTALTKNGFAITKNNKRVTSFRKNQSGALLANYFILSLVRKPNDPTFRRCTVVMSLTHRAFAETSSPEFYDFMTGLKAEFERQGNTWGVATDKFGGRHDAWVGRNGTYKVTFNAQSPVIFVEVTLE